MRLMADERWEEAKQPLERLLAIFPDDRSANSSLLLLSRVYRELGQREEELRMLAGLAALRSDDVPTLLRLMELHSAEGDWQSVRDFAQQMLAINPLVPAPHRYLAQAAEHLTDAPAAIESLGALLLLDPADPADLHFRLARLHLDASDLQAARRHVLLALEDAPRYREAHRLLLEITKRIGATSHVSTEKDETQ
jgi:tetratricopeptide (TPR) repeat protein